jgi:hypothetical protein
MNVEFRLLILIVIVTLIIIGIIRLANFVFTSLAGNAG